MIVIHFAVRITRVQHCLTASMSFTCRFPFPPVPCTWVNVCYQVQGQARRGKTGVLAGNHSFDLIGRHYVRLGSRTLENITIFVNSHSLWQTQAQTPISSKAPHTCLLLIRLAAQVICCVVWLLMSLTLTNQIRLSEMMLGVTCASQWLN